ARFLEPLHYNTIPGFQTLGHFPHCANAFAHFHRTNAYLVIVTYNCDLIAALQLIHRFLRYHHRAFLHIGDKTHISKLSGPQNVPRIRKSYIVTDRSGLDVKTAIERVKFALLRIYLAIAEN